MGVGNNASGPFAALLVAAYASGAYTSRRDGRIAAGIIAVLVVAMSVETGEDVAGDAVFIGGILFAVWGAATVVRSRQELAAALAARTVELDTSGRRRPSWRSPRSGRGSRASSTTWWLTTSR